MKLTLYCGRLYENAHRIPLLSFKLLLRINSTQQTRFFFFEFICEVTTVTLSHQMILIASLIPPGRFHKAVASPPEAARLSPQVGRPKIEQPVNQHKNTTTGHRPTTRRCLAITALWWIGLQLVITAPLGIQLVITARWGILLTLKKLPSLRLRLVQTGQQTLNVFLSGLYRVE